MNLRAYVDAEPFTTKDGSTIRELMHAPNQSLAEATLAPGQATERHYHALSEELYSFLEGGGRSRSTATNGTSPRATPS